MAGNSRLRQRLGSVGLLVAGTLVAVLLAEVLLRVRARLEDRGLLTPHLELPPDPLPEHPASLGGIIKRSPDPLLLYDLRPHLRVIYENARVTTSAEGVRNPAHPTAPPARSFRLVGIGDSFMFGLGVADGETYLARLESALNAERPGASPACAVEVVNLGVPGYNTVMEVTALERKGLAYRPDLVVIEFISNDFDLPNFVWRARDVTTLRRSFLWDLAGDAWRSRQRGRRARAGVEPLEEAAQDGTPDGIRFVSDPARVAPEHAALVGWTAHERAMRRLARLAREHRFEVVLMGWDVHPEEERVRGLGRELGFHVLDLHGRLSRYVRKQGYASYQESPLARRRWDNHPSAAGHEVISRFLADFLREEKLLPPDRACGP